MFKTKSVLTSDKGKHSVSAGNYSDCPGAITEKFLFDVRVDYRPLCDHDDSFQVIPFALNL